jgi:predicted nucleic-acid-binding protein
VIALDTNVLVRFLTRDDAEQSSLVDELIETLDAENGAFVSRDVMLELVWVLGKGYGYRRAEIARALQALMEAEEFEIEDEAAVHQALDAYAQGGPGFADHLILRVARARGCHALATFDRKLAQLDGVRLLGSKG